MKAHYDDGIWTVVDGNITVRGPNREEVVQKIKGYKQQIAAWERERLIS